METMDMINTIREKDDYFTVLDAVSGEKTEFTADESQKLLDIYTKNGKRLFGFENEALVKAVLALLMPGTSLLDKADADALAILCELIKNEGPDKANAVKAAALSGDVSAPLALAMARAALDAYAGQKDLAPYREDIRALADVLRGADEAAFADACVFLIHVRVWARG